MENRYTELFRLEPGTHQDGCPVYLEAGALLRDNAAQRVLAQLKLKNLAAGKVVSCTVEIRASAVNGSALEGVTFQYADLSVENGISFAERIPILLPDDNTRRIQLVIREVVLEPFRVWTASDEEARPLPQPEKLENLLGDERCIRQYSQRVGKPCVYIPKCEQGLFLCTCGRVNLAEDQVCGKCGCTFEQLQAKLDPEAIREEAARQLREEEEARQEAERQEAARREEERRQLEEMKQERRQKRERTRKKLVKAMLLLLCLVLVGTLGTLAVTRIAIPAMEQKKAYQAAQELFAAGAYGEAEEAFLALGDYQDSPDRALQSRYQIAQVYYESGNFEQAIAVWEGMNGYSDSADRAAQALIDWKEEDYQSALALKQQTRFLDAAEAFALLGDYKDSAALRDECVELQNDADYTAAEAAVSGGDYPTAIGLFQKLGDYRDSDQKYLQTCYLHGASLYDGGSYMQAVTWFQAAGEYEDASQRAIEATYQYGCQLLAEEKFTDAIRELSKCADYSDAAKKLQDAKFGYVNANLKADNQTTQTYLKELIDARYPGAQKVHDELYAWKVEIVAFNNSPYDSSYNMTSLSKYQYMCVHFKLTGGVPDTTTNIRTTITLPSGYSGNIPHPNVSDGYIGCSYGWYDTPAYAPAGTLTFRAYDESGKLLLTATVPVTN